MWWSVQTNTKGKTLRNSRSQMFFKTAALKNSQYCQEVLAWFLLKKRHQHRCFPVNIAEFLRRVYKKTPVQYIFPKFYVMIEFFGRLCVQNWHFSYFLCHCFVFLHNSVRISIPWLFRTYFHTKIFSKCNFRKHYVGSNTILIESLKFRNNSRITVSSPSNLLCKLWIWVFWILCFVVIFL